MTSKTDRGVRWRFIASNAALATLMVLSLAANVDSYRDDPRLSVLVLMAFTTIILVLALIRRDIESVDRRFLPYLAALIAVTTPFWLRPEATGEDLLIGQVVQIGALVFQGYAVVSLGRSFGVVPSNRGIKTGGAYRLVRHPIYAAHILGTIGFLISHRTWLNLTAVLVALVTQTARIFYEERLLLQVPEYARYAASQRWRLIPGLW